MKNTDTANRKGFLRAALGIGAGSLAARLDPDGEPKPDSVPAVVINGDNVTLPGLYIRSDGGRTAVEWHGQHGTVMNSHFVLGEDSKPALRFSDEP
jgi:hypothetical protein